MNCTLMGGFWFEAGKTLFGITAAFAIIAAITLFALCWVLARNALEHWKP